MMWMKHYSSIKNKGKKVKRYKLEIETVITNGLIVGYRTRSYVGGGINMSDLVTWKATVDIENPKWIYGFNNRAEAREHLEALFVISEVPTHWESNTRRKYDA
jgi:hypothetical protein